MIEKTFIEDLVVIIPKRFGDSRGWFSETYNENEFSLNTKFIQDNHSYSKEKGTLRGLHMQKSPYAQSKLVRCTRGSVYDVAVDLRKNSKTYLKWFGIELSSENGKQLFVPQGFAHGFITLTDDVEFQYKVDNYYNKESEITIKYDDPTIGVIWPNIKVIQSSKDQEAKSFKELIDL